MKPIASFVRQYQAKPVEKSKITNKRQTIVKRFLDTLNAARVGAINPKTKKPMKPLSAAFVGTKMRFMTTEQLFQFYGYCAEARNFSSTWWWALDPKNYDNNGSIVDKFALDKKAA